MYNIDFNNKNSYYDLGLVVSHRPVISNPVEIVNVINVLGKPPILEHTGIYENLDIIITFNIKDDDLNSRMRLIREWLNVTHSELSLSDDMDYFYKVKNVTLDITHRKLKTLGTFNVTFTCEPYLYLKIGTVEIEVNKNDILFNDGIDTSPIIQVFGNGNGNLIINDNEISLVNIDGYLTINSEIFSCYKDDINCNKNMIGDFPKLIEGNNLINWNGDIERVVIVPNWKEL